MVRARLSSKHNPVTVFRLLDTARTITSVLCMWAWYVTYHSNIIGLLTYGREFVIDFFLEGFTTFIVQIYIIYCIWRAIQHRRYQLLLTMTMGIMCLVSFGFCIATVYSMAQSSLIVDSIPRTALPVCTHILTAGVTDIYIAISFSFILHGKRTGFRGTDHIITRLVLYTIQRGIVVTLVHFIEFATFFSTLHARPFKLFWLVLYFSGSKLNVNSLLALLNIRDHLKSHKPTDYIGDNVLLGINQGGRAERHQNIYALQVLGDDHTSQSTMTSVVGPATRGDLSEPYFQVNIIT